MHQVPGAVNFRTRRDDRPGFELPDWTGLPLGTSRCQKCALRFPRCQLCTARFEEVAARKLPLLAQMERKR